MEYTYVRITKSKNIFPLITLKDIYISLVEKNLKKIFKKKLNPEIFGIGESFLFGILIFAICKIIKEKIRAREILMKIRKNVHKNCM